VREMTPDETRAFLLAGTRTGKLATTLADGRPHVTPIWFVLDIPSLSPSQGSGFAATVGKAAVAAGDDVVWTTGETSVKAKAIRSDPRVCMCVDDQAPPYSYVMIEGMATLSDDLDALRHWATVIGGRYMGAERAEEFGNRNAVRGELLVRVTPTRVLARADIAE
jgi:PPOX class probable F420-dependent enzyme